MSTRPHPVGLLVGSVAFAALLLQGCGGCNEPPPAPPLKPVQGNVPKAPEAAPQAPVPEAKEACGVLVFSEEDTGPAPFSVQLSAEGDCTMGTARIEWDFGDGTPKATGAVLIHTFEKPGTYKVTGRITSDELPGLEDIDYVDIVVTAPPG